MTVEHNSRRLTHMQLAAEVLQSFGTVRLEVRGPSMLPFLFPGDVLTVNRRSAQSIERGDLVVYTRGEFFVVHRVVRKLNTSGQVRLITRGDALINTDAPVLESDLLGYVALVERGPKRWRPRQRVNLFARLVGSAIRGGHALLVSFSLWRYVRPFVRKTASVAISFPAGVTS